MADRYQDRPFPPDSRQGSAGGDDPLAELARLIGQNDPRGAMGRANQPVRPRAPSPPPREELPQAPAGGSADAASGPLPWMQRANRPEAPQPELPNAGHPLQRNAPPQPVAGPEFRQAAPSPAHEPAEDSDATRYDEALYGQIAGDAQDSDLDQAFADDGYSYQDGYEDELEDPAPKRRGLVTVAAVMALALVGTGGALAYRTFFGCSRGGEPPIIRADAGPTKIMPSNSDTVAKVPDRLSPGDGTERIVPREETPVDVDAQSGPRVVLPSLGQSGGAGGLPPISSSALNTPVPAGGTSGTNGTGALANNEPRKIRTLSVRGDQQDPGAVVAQAAPAPGKPAPVVRSIVAQPRNPAAAANANASAPLALVPQPSSDPAPAAAADTRTRVANTAPASQAPAAPASAAAGGYVVQVSSQASEADAQASFKTLQTKFPAVLGAHSPLIKRADLGGDKGIRYRALVGPFGSRDEATQLCSSLTTAGGQCFVQKN